MNPPKLLVDENLSPTIAVTLRSEGTDAIHVRDRALNSASDEEVFALAYAEDRIVVTFNINDFEELARNCELHGGLIMLPGETIPRAQQLALVREAWDIVRAEYDAGLDMINRVLYIEMDGSHRLEMLP